MNRTVVGAHYGLRDWLAQRVTAVAMALYAAFMALALGRVGTGYEFWRELMGDGIVRFATFLFVVSLALHAWIGMRDIWMDYVRPAALRLTLHVLTALVLIGNAGWAIRVLWRLS